MQYITNTAYQPSRTAKVYRLAEEVYADHPEFDYLIVDAFRGVHQLIGHREEVVWRMLKDGKTLGEVVSLLSLDTGKYEGNYVTQLLEKWEDVGLVSGKSGIVKQDPIRNIWSRLMWNEIAVGRFPGIYRHIYKWGGRFLFSFIGFLALTFLVALAITLGVDLLLNGALHGGYDFGGWRLALVLPIAWGSLALHELGHALAMGWARAPIARAGIALYFGLPVMFVDTVTVWAKRRYQRIVVSISGFAVNAILAAGAIIGMYFTYSAGRPLWDAILWEIFTINLLMLAISLIPFLKMDGYYVLIDLIGLPQLDRQARTELHKFVSHPLQTQLTRREMLLLSYGLISFIFAGLLIGYAAYYWYGLVSAVF
jgi:Zn-dependent protease